ncbi:uncharacterized protein LOC123307368 [Coccinella septempunctata]|uniref:uncharacterized protein LOC123307368 n=1 Tax=Coccinella septempunctata TaxID=41139 RepID=UPI001D065D3B|nr:uncharacterized protein LOC123307368 [Coccinella septempunctata]
MGYDVMSVERKMKVLKTQFMHCYKLYKKYSINGDSYQPKWFAYNSLRFLIPAKIYRENREISRMQEQGVQLIKTETIDIPSEENFIVNEREEPQSPADITLRNSTLNIPPLTSLNPNVAFRPDTRRNEETSIQRCHPGVGRDEYSIFGEWIACRMRNLQDPRARLTLQFNINNLLFDAEMQEIDRINDSSHPDRTLNGM